MSVRLSVCLSARFLSNCGSGGYQTWICGYVQRVLGTARVWSRTAKEQRVYTGRLNGFLVKAGSVVYTKHRYVGRYEEHFTQQESGAALSKSSMYVYVSIRTVVGGNMNDD